MARIFNRDCWAIGSKKPGGFSVRRVVWGRVLARAEKRPGEEIWAVVLMFKGEEPERQTEYIGDRSAFK